MASNRARGFIADWNPYAKSRVLLAQVEQVLADYAAYLPLTCRQIFYRLVATVAYEKTEAAYGRLGELLNSARRAGVIPFEHIRNDGIKRLEPDGYSSLEAAMRSITYAVEQYTRRRDQGQPVRSLVICEAAGMAPQLQEITTDYGATILPSGGFDSTTAKHDLAQDIATHFRDTGQDTRILHIGDHDPSGVHVFSNLAEDVGAFVAGLEKSAKPSFVRVAVTEAQIVEHSLETAPAKPTDRRAFAGVGSDASATVQAEALPPDLLAVILREALEEGWSEAAHRRLVRAEKDERRRLAEWLARAGEP